MIPFVGAIISALGSIGSSWLETRKVKAKGKIQIAQAKIQARVEKEAAKANMDLSAMDNMRYSWKDEYLVILLSIPVIMCFVPTFTIMGVTYDLPSLALAGFEKLKQTPEWYRWALTGMIAATFGLRTWFGYKGK